MLGHEDIDWPRVALSVSRIVFYTIDCASGRIARSAASEELLGMPAAGPIGDWVNIIFPEDLSQFEDAMKAVSQAAPGYEIEYRIRHAVTEKRFWVLDRGEARFDATGMRAGMQGAIIDIGARVSIEREFRKAARLRSIVFEAARMAAWHLDAAAGRFTCTDELLELLETGRRDFDGTPRAIENSIHPDDLEAWCKARADALSPGGRMEIEFRVVLRGGAIRWLLSRGEIVRDFAGAPQESYGVMIDITDRKKSEEAVAQLAAIVASSEDAILSKNLRGIITSWNQGAERLYGYSAEEMIGQPVSKLFPLQSGNEENNILDTIRNGDAITPYESVRLHKSGRAIDVSIAVSPIRDARGEVVGASTIARDISERRRHNETLLQNEARLRLALRSARAGAWDYDLERRELHWSPEMFALYGLDPAHGLPARDSLARQIAPAHRKRVRREFSRALLHGGSFTLEFPIIRPGGSEIWTALAGDVVKNERGRPVSARGIDQDITERKSWEKRQAQLLRELSHRVKNTLAVIQSVARQTLRTAASPKSFVEAFEGRIHSLAATHNLLTEADWSGAGLDAVIRSQMAAMNENFDRRFKLRGPEVVLSAELATQLGLVLHELAANAEKYGALSVPQGKVDVGWTASKSKLSLLWRERGGPELQAAPAYSGFGTMLILSSALKVSRRFARGGLVCKLHLAL